MGMNLHAIVSGAIAVLNTPFIGLLAISRGNTLGADHRQRPLFEVRLGVEMQVQPMTGDDLAQIDSLNIQGVVRKVFLNGNIQGINRPAGGKGGDLLRFNGQTWLVKAVLETWDNPGWCSVAVVEQMGYDEFDVLAMQNGDLVATQDDKVIGVQN